MSESRYCHERGEEHDFDRVRGRMNAARHCTRCPAISLDWDDVPHFHWGQNVPGYLPWSLTSNIAATFDEAKRGLIEDIKRDEDHAAMFEDGEELAEELSSAAEDVNLWTEPGGYLVVEDPAREHDLGIAYWIQECAEEECAQYEEEGED